MKRGLYLIPLAMAYKRGIAGPIVQCSNVAAVPFRAVCGALCPPLTLG